MQEQAKSLSFHYKEVYYQHTHLCNLGKPCPLTAKPHTAILPDSILSCFPLSICSSGTQGKVNPLSHQQQHPSVSLPFSLVTSKCFFPIVEEKEQPPSCNARTHLLQNISLDASECRRE